MGVDAGLLEAVLDPGFAEAVSELVEDEVGPVAGTAFDDGQHAELGAEVADGLDDGAQEAREDGDYLRQVEGEEVFDFRRIVGDVVAPFQDVVAVLQVAFARTGHAPEDGVAQVHYGVCVVLDAAGFHMRAVVRRLRSLIAVGDVEDHRLWIAEGRDGRAPVGFVVDFWSGVGFEFILLKELGGNGGDGFMGQTVQGRVLEE